MSVVRGSTGPVPLSPEPAAAAATASSGLCSVIVLVSLFKKLRSAMKKKDVNYKHRCEV